MSAITPHGFELVDWQRRAVDRWEAGAQRPYTGTLEIFTGGGKTLLALEAMHRASICSPDLRVAIVVPTQALAKQWREVLRTRTDLGRDDVGLLGAGGKGDLIRNRVLVAVLNTAAKRLPEMARSAQPMMLIVDECHRAGAPTFSKVLDTPADYRLGLSATPEREELDDEGEPIKFDEQLVGHKLGKVVDRFTLRDAREIGWLPDYQLDHHGLELRDDERQRYEQITRRVDEIGDQLRDMGADTARAQRLQRRSDDLGMAARAYIAATSQRKDLLYRAAERNRVATRLVLEALADDPRRRILLFHERVDEAEQLFGILKAELATGSDDQTFAPATGGIRLEHSRLPIKTREAALAAFRTGEANVLVSVKSLIEGIDVPDADIGISVASTSSVRQRVQALGRVLRRQFDVDAPAKSAVMHLLYVADTVDDLIYGKEDWADLTGTDANRYWHWPLDPELSPEPMPGPPRSPRPTEEQEWQRLGERAPSEPVPWEGVFVGQEYSVDTLGTVTNQSGAIIANPQSVGEMMTSVRRHPGGRFRITPMHRLVLIARDATSGGGVFVAGALTEAFEVLDDVDEDGASDTSELAAGDPYRGPSDKSGGTYKIRQKQGGVVERKGPGRSGEFAAASGARSELIANLDRVLTAWRSVLDRGITFNVNERGDAWYTAEGARRFLAHVPGGFAWPSETEDVDGVAVSGSDPLEHQQGREVLGGERPRPDGGASDPPDRTPGASDPHQR